MTSSRRKQNKADRAPWVDRGAIAGSFAAAAVLGVWLLVTLGEREADGDGAASSPAQTPPAVPQHAAPAPPPEPDPRQEVRTAVSEAIALGKEGLQDFVDAETWREEVGGDPFHYANLVEQAKAKVTRAMVALESLRDEAQGDAATVKTIDEWLAYFEKKVPRRKK